MERSENAGANAPQALIPAFRFAPGGLRQWRNVTSRPSRSPAAEHMIYRVMSDDAARRESGKRDVLAAIAGRKIVAK
jgi:hypothetical protein